MKVTVYSDKIEEVTKKLESLKKKATKYGSSFNYEIGEPHVEEVVCHYDSEFIPGEGYVAKTSTIHVEAVDVDCDDIMIRMNGWTVIAKLDHMDEGNVVTYFGDGTYPEGWVKIAPFCEHCKTNHKRNVTYMVKNENGEIRQVGSSCLKDYTGIDPALAISFAGLVTFFRDEHYEVDDETYWDLRGGVSNLWDVKEIIALACDSIAKYGYRKSDYPDSTKEHVGASYGTVDVSKEAVEKAEKIMAWVLNEEHEVHSYEWESRVLVKNEWCKPGHIGRLVWLPCAYDKEMERREKIAKRAAETAKEAAVSGYLGEVGKKIEVEIESAKLLSSWDSEWGTTYLYKFEDVDGNVLIWYASRSQDIDGVKKLKGTVKAHNTRDGVKQTVVTRCSLTVVKPEPKGSAAKEGFDLFWEYVNGNEDAFEEASLKKAG